MTTRQAAPGSTRSLRAANQERVLDVLRAQEDENGIAQAELARVTGLAPATVSNIVRDLAQTGLLDITPGSGRRGSSVRISGRAGVVAGIDVGHSHLAVAIGDGTGRVLAEARDRLAPDATHQEALSLADGLFRSIDPQVGPLRGVALGLPAPVTDEIVRSPAILPGWVGVDPRAAATTTFDVPAIVENDANLGALAEHRRGMARGTDSSVFVKISSGVGAGIIVANQVFRGAFGTAGEIGHLTLDDQGPLCRCGSRGCLEAYASIGTIQAQLADQLPDASLEEVLRAAGDGNGAVRRAFEDAGLHLGWGLASVVNLLNPAVVVVGGEIARAGDLVLEPARVALRRHALDAVAQTPIVASELGERASLLGAVLLAADQVDLSAPLH